MFTVANTVFISIIVYIIVHEFIAKVSGLFVVYSSFLLWFFSARCVKQITYVNKSLSCCKGASERELLPSFLLHITLLGSEFEGKQRDSLP